MGQPEDKKLLRSAEVAVDTCVAHRLRLISRVISNIYNEELSKNGLTVSQFNILTVIIAGKSISPTFISTNLQIEKSTLSRNLELMRKNSWITMESAGRGIVLGITAKGKKAFQVAYPQWERAQERSVAILGKNEIQRIFKIALEVSKSQTS
ncbi:MAG TPA: MarR family winged helix-turn-helix transcriptional regulator [Bdellovibrionota bacterium]|jgi:DNA-binding MarR family transcriptional regulator